MRRPEIVIAADDLTGAADSGSAFAVQGLRTIVQLSENGPDAETQVLSIDTATRAMSVEQAAAVAKNTFEKHRDARVFYKKIDSLLRGHVGPELAAMLRDAAPAVAVMAPAFPSQGRVTRGGCQWLRGERLESADAPRVLSAAGLAAAVIGLDIVRGGRLAGAMTDLAKLVDVLVCDAETEDDLAAIAGATAVLPREVIWVGSAGLARHIPKALGIAGVAEEEPGPSFRGSIMVIVGSRTAVAHEQVRNAGLKVNAVTPEELRAGTAALDPSDDAVIGITATEENAEDPGLSAALAELVTRRLDGIGALVVTGGETARAVLRRLGITGLRLGREIEMGVPMAVSMGARRMPVITKSGSFGNPMTLRHCVEALRKLKLEEHA